MAHPFRSLLPIVFSSMNDRDLVAAILRLIPGVKNADVDDIRTVQTAACWWRGFGEGVSFEEYLEQIPPAPDFAALQEKFPMLDLPTLVDARLGHCRCAELAGLRHRESGYVDGMLEPFDDRHSIPMEVPYWALAHNGELNLGLAPPYCRSLCTGRLLAGTAEMLIAICVQYGFPNHRMDGPGSVRVGSLRSDYCALVDPFGHLGPGLHGLRNGEADPACGSVVFVQALRPSASVT